MGGKKQKEIVFGFKPRAMEEGSWRAAAREREAGERAGVGLTCIQLNIQNFWQNFLYI